MPNVNDYITANKAADRSAETAKVSMMAASVAAANTTKDATSPYIQLDKLENEADRLTFVNTFNTTIMTPYAATIAAMPEDDAIARNLLMNGNFGFSEADIMNTVKQAGKNMQIDQFQSGLSRRLGRTRETRYAHATNLLEGIPNRDFLNDVGLNRATRPGALTLDDKFKLAGEFDRAGVVGPTIYTGKPYM